MLIEKDFIQSNIQTSSLHHLLSESSPTLVLLPKLEIIVNKEEPTLEDILTICSHDQGLLDKLTRRSGFEGSSEDFAKDILFKKGLGFLKSLAIRTMNQEIFTLPLGLNGMSTGLIKRRSVILARFLKYFRADLDREPDDLYLAGLLYNFHYVTYEQLVKVGQFEGQDFDAVRSECLELTCGAFSGIGFDPYIVGILEDSEKQIFETKNPFEQALLKIANDTLEKAEQTQGMLGRKSRINRTLLDATGYSEREILSLLKDLSKNYKGTSVPWQR
jgi:hypothetical protein